MYNHISLRHFNKHMTPHLTSQGPVPIFFFKDPVPIFLRKKAPPVPNNFASIKRNSFDPSLCFDANFLKEVEGCVIPPLMTYKSPLKTRSVLID